MKRFLKYVWKATETIFLVFFLFLGSLFFREQKIPRPILARAVERVSSSNLVVSCEGASFGFRRGLVLMNPAAYDLTRENRMAPVVSARSVAVNLLTREVRAVGVKYARLPNAYYSEECRERNAPLRAEFPKIRPFRLVLERPEILGVTPARVSLTVSARRHCIDLDDIHLDWWPEKARRSSVDGVWRIDLDTQKVTGEVHGLATQAQVRPLIEVLDITSALPYIDAFTGVTGPVAARSDYEIDLARGDFKMNLTLSPKTPTYRGAPFREAEGTISLDTGVRGTNRNVALTVDLASATDLDGHRLSGRLGVTLTNDVPRLSFDVKSGLSFENALKLTEFLTPDDLSPITCLSSPKLTVTGHCGTSAADLAHNDIRFDVRLKEGAFLGFHLQDIDSTFTLKGDEIVFEKATGTGRTGGKVSAPGRLRLPGFGPDRAEFAVRVDYANGSLAELADFLKFDLGERDGHVNGWCELAAPATTNFAARLNGEGHVEVTEGHLAQMKLFAGLTNILAEKVPGVGFLVNQSQASSDFTISNGVFRSENVYIEGGLVSLKGWGSYDIPNDNLDFTARVQFMKKDSLMGKLLHPVTFPFTKLLLEFRVKGPIDNPSWNYISVIDRIL